MNNSVTFDKVRDTISAANRIGWLLTHIVCLIGRDFRLDLKSGSFLAGHI